MKKILVSVLLMLSLLTVATPAAAAKKVRVGIQFDLLTGTPTTDEAASLIRQGS